MESEELTTVRKRRTKFTMSKVSIEYSYNSRRTTQGQTQNQYLSSSVLCPFSVCHSRQRLTRVRFFRKEDNGGSQYPYCLLMLGQNKAVSTVNCFVVDHLTVQSFLSASLLWMREVSFRVIMKRIHSGYTRSFDVFAERGVSKRMGSSTPQ